MSFEVALPGTCFVILLRIEMFPLSRVSGNLTTFAHSDFIREIRRYEISYF